MERRGQCNVPSRRPPAKAKIPSHSGVTDHGVGHTRAVGSAETPEVGQAAGTPRSVLHSSDAPHTFPPLSRIVGSPEQAGEISSTIWPVFTLQ